MSEVTPTTQILPSLSKLFTALRGFSLLRTAAGTLGLKVGAAGLGFINSILLARLLGPADFGLYSIVLSVVNFTSILAVLGLPIFVTREAAASAEHEQWNRLKGRLSAAHRWTLLAVLAILGVTTGLLVGGIVKPAVSWQIIGIAMMLLPLVAFNQLRAAILRGLHWVILSDIPELLLRPVMMLMLLIGSYLTAIHATAVHALGMQFASSGVALIAGSWWLVKLQPVQLKVATSEPPPQAWMLGALPFLFIAIIGTLQGQVPLYLIGYLKGAEQAGLFNAANQLVGLIAIGLYAINIPLQPQLAAAWARGDKQQAQRLVTETARIGTVIALVGVLTMLLFAETILRLYGAQYVEAAYALRILAIGQMVKASAGACDILLMMIGYQKIVVLGRVFALLLMVVIASLSIPPFGLVGGALAAALGMIFLNVFFSLYAKTRLDLNTTIFNTKLNLK